MLTRRDFYVRNLFEDLRDGVILVNFLELLAADTHGFPRWNIEERESGIPERDVNLAFRMMSSAGINTSELSMRGNYFHLLKEKSYDGVDILDGNEYGTLCVLQAIRKTFFGSFQDRHSNVSYTSNVI